MDYKLELVSLPVSDVDASIAFYRDKAGFDVDHDHKVSDELRFVQVTPPGSACSITFGVGISDKEPGSATNLQVVVDDADAAHADLESRGVDVSEVDEQPWGRFVYFKDPDGNPWSVQEIVTPGS